MPYVHANAEHTTARVPFPLVHPPSPTYSSPPSSPTSSTPSTPSEECDRSRPRKKSSLKKGARYRTPSPNGRGSPLPRSKSVPDGIAKLVHFPSQDSDLQRVRTFSLAQRPSAISNPNSDAEDDSSDEEETVLTPNSSKYRIDPSRSRLPSDAVPTEGTIKLDALDFGHDAVLRGRVRVANVAYNKRVAARFSLDGWDSTSEVLASYLSSSPCSKWDTWTFSIRLEDITLRNRVLLLCVHYVAEGTGEFWDNNMEKDYACVFSPVQTAAYVPHASWEPLNVPRRRSATTGAETKSYVNLQRVHQNRSSDRPGYGWQDWAKNNQSFKLQPAPRTSRPMFVM